MAVDRPGWQLLGVAVLVVLAVGGAASLADPAEGAVQVARCTAEPTTVAPGETVTLDASASEGDFVEFDKQGNGDYTIIDRTDFVVNVTYDQTGTYQPMAMADGDSASIDSCGTVTVKQTANEPPVAALSISPRPGTVGEQVTFDASNSTDPDGDIVEYRWDFEGDGTIDNTTSSPFTTFTYQDASWYGPTVTVVDDGNATDIAGADFRVDEAPPQPVARCRVEPMSAEVGETVLIDATASENASLIDYDTDGDGVYEFFELTNFTLEWSYENSGTYTPRVRVHGNGETDTADCGAVTVNEPPIADLTISPRPGTVGEQVTFDASGSSDPDGNIVEYRWDFDGDGITDETTASSTTTFTYQNAGPYGPSVTVVDDANATDMAGADFRVEEGSPDPLARCVVEPRTVEPGETVVIDARGSENAISIDYDTDGDGEYEVLDRSEFVLEWSYDEPGTYTPQVRVRGETSGDTADCGEVVVEEPNEPPIADLTISPRPGTVGEQVTFDASGSSDPDGNIVEYRWDFDGDGTIDETTPSSTTTFTFQDPGSYGPAVTVVDDANATDIAGADYRVNEPAPEPLATCAVEPRTVEPGDTVVIDASASENAFSIDFDPDGDGEYEVLDRSEFVLEWSYDEAGTYTPRVRVRGETSGNVTDCGEIVVEAQNEPPEAALSISPESAGVGEAVTFDASGSSDPDGDIVEYRWDFDGDGTIDETTTDPTTTRTFQNEITNVASVTVVDDEGATDTAERDYVVEPDEEGLPLIPIGIGTVGVLGLGGLLWYFFGGTGGGGGGSGQRKSRPRTRSTSVDPRYETGVFEIPSSSKRLSVPVGFDPDLVLFSASNGVRADSATDRTAGWSRGRATATGDGIENFSVTVADDGQSTDQATCATSEEYALQMVRHETESPPGRVTVALAGTTGEAFEVDVSVPGDDPMAGSIRVLYQAFRTATDVDVNVGQFRTPTEPGIQTVDLGVEADHVSLTGTAAVTGPGRLWTTDRGVGLTAGQMVADPEDGIDQTVWGASAWPGSGHDSGAVADVDRALHLLYQDGDRIAGRTRASTVGLGSTLRLQYDRVYNGPHKLGSTARHVVMYLAMAGGDSMRPAVGAVPFPRPGDTLTIETGFQPELIEIVVSGAPLGEEVPTWAAPQPFGWSHGTAIVGADRLRQYVLHHAALPAVPEASVSASAPAVEPGDVTADGGVTEAASDSTPLETQSPPVDGTTGGQAVTDVPPAADHPDDGIAGLYLPQAPDGTIVGREECRVTGLKETAFEVTVESIDKDQYARAGKRPTIIYRAWPTVDGSATGSEAGRAESRDSQETAGSGTSRTGRETGEGQR
ncbi:MAG: PKD repeat protein [Natrialbaceae archaeon]|jgi:PKD repeat protein